MRRCFPFLILWLAVISSSVSAQTFTINPNPTDPARALGATVGSISLADYNGDGRLDLYSPGFLFKQGADRSFSNVVELAGVDYIGGGKRGAIFGDANFDGLLDLIILDSDPGSPIFLNRTGGIFEYGNFTVNMMMLDPPVGGFWRDLNGDGWLDFAAAYFSGNHALYGGLTNGRFSDLGATANFRTNGRNCGLVPGDYDNDGDMDVYGLGCTSANTLLTFTGSPTRPRFTDRGSIAGVASTRKSTAARWFDYNNDGWQDLIVANSLEPDFNEGKTLLYRNKGNGQFEDVAELAGIPGLPRQPNTPLEIADFDNDGWVDVYLPSAGLGRLYRNKGNGTFEEIFAAATGLQAAPATIAAGDFDNDGWMDLIMPGTGILYNDGGTNNWITFEAKEDIKNRFGVGARLTITSSAGLQTRVIEAGTGGLGHGDGLKAHFGLGTDTVVDRLEIDWPGGATQVLTNLAANAHYVVVSGVGINEPPSLFDLTNPPPTGFLPVTADSVRFGWEPSLDTDDVSYTLSVSGKGLSLTFPDLDTESFTLSTSLLPPNQVYQWSVLATDGHSVRYNGEERIFTFGQAGTSVSTLVQPYSYGFGLPEVFEGTVRFFDADLDGDLDVLVGGQGKERPVIGLYRTESVNIPLPGDGGGSYQFKSLMPAPQSLEAVSFPKITWGSIMDDATPEIIVSGISSVTYVPKTTVYINTGTDIVPVVGLNLPQVWGGNVELADIDANGTLDLFITGSTSLEEPYAMVSTIYRNAGDANFVDSGMEIPGFMFGDSAFGDMDGDGDLDVAMTGDRGNGELFSAIYRNNGSTFTEIQTDLPGLLNGSASWADYDLDGDLDLFLTGGRLSPEILQGVSSLYINENGTFVQHPFAFDGILQGEAAWGDYDSDGDPDLILSGATKPYGPSVTRLYRNENGQFAAELDLEGLSRASLAFGDYNGDGDDDIIMAGKDKDGKIVMRFLINLAIPELIPGRK